VNITRRTLLIIASLLAFQLLAFCLTSRAFFLQNFARLEEQFALRNTERALVFLESQEQNLVAIARDWAAWDDTYYFVQEPTEDYIKSNLVDETFEGLGINLMLFINTSGELVFGKAYDLEAHKEVPLPKGWEEHFHPGSPLLHHTDPKDGKVGLISLPQGPMLIVSYPIVTSKEEGPIMGTFVMGYYLTQAHAEKLSEVVRSPVSFLPPHAPQVPARLAKGEKFALRVVDSRTLEAFALLEDFYGQPALILKVTMPRELYPRSQAAFFLFSLQNLFLGLVFGAVILLFLRQHLLSRLTRLSESLEAIARSGDISARVAVEGRDELAEVGVRVNELLSSLEASRKALEESERWHRLLINSITDGLWVVDRELKLQQANEPGAGFLGRKAEEISGKSMQELLEEPAFSDFREAFSRTLERGTVQTLSIPAGEKTLELRLYPIPDGALCIVRDITELRRMESFYIRAQRMEAAGSLALAIAHDFNNFLTPILASTELILSGSVSPQESLALLEEVRKACEKASALVRQLLLFGRREPLAPETLNLNSVIMDMRSLISRTLGEGVELILELSPDLYPIKANRSHLEQILMNLVMNARDAMPEGGKLWIKTENVRITEEALAHPEAYPGEFVRLVVKDTGIGMSPEVKERIFEPFFTTKEPKGGTGLGLSVVYSIVKQNRGWIEVESKLGEGTSFSLYFPAAKPEA
jgi:PAS domain S-box-containing protein